MRAGLAVIDAVRALNLPQPLAVPLGVASGLGVVGDLIGEGAAQERGVFGETPNLAAACRRSTRSTGSSLPTARGANLGVCSRSKTAGRTRSPASPRAWKVVGESDVVGCFEALHTQKTPLVGRDEELDLLRCRWRADQGRQGPGRADRRRAHRRQVATDCSAGREHRRRAAQAAALLRVAAPSGQRASPVHHPARTRRRLRPRRNPGGEARQARGADRRRRWRARRDHADRRAAVTAKMPQPSSI